MIKHQGQKRGNTSLEMSMSIGKEPKNIAGLKIVSFTLLLHKITNIIYHLIDL